MKLFLMISLLLTSSHLMACNFKKFGAFKCFHNKEKTQFSHNFYVNPSRVNLTYGIELVFEKKKGSFSKITYTEGTHAIDTNSEDYVRRIRTELDRNDFFHDITKVEVKCTETSIDIIRESLEIFYDYELDFHNNLDHKEFTSIEFYSDKVNSFVKGGTLDSSGIFKEDPRKASSVYCDPL